MKWKFFGLCLAMTLTGCVTITATKAVGITGKEICVVNNPDVITDFRDAYERQIQAKGYSTKVVADASACPIIATYAATYGYHWGPYLATAEFKILNGGVEIGRANYKAPYASPEKHGRIEGKIESIIAKLLP